jgi:hypothetical protein
VEHGNSGHSTSANAAEAPDDATTASGSHGNSGHDSHANSASEPGAADVAKPSVATNGNAESGSSSQHAAQSAAIVSDAAQPAKATSDAGGAAQELVFRFDSVASPPALVATVEPKELDHPHVPPGRAADVETIVKITPDALDELATNHGNNGSHHATVPAPHDLLI